MRHFKQISYFFLLSLLVSSTLSAPLLAAGDIYSQQSQQQTLSIENLDLSALSFLSSRRSGQQLLDFKASSIFDMDLNEYYSSEDFTTNTFDEDIELIIMFDEGVSKVQRITILNTVLDDYSLIYNYEIISAVAIKCDAKQILEKETLFRAVEEVQFVSLSHTFEMPYIKDATPKTSALDEDDFPNWWVSAAGADSVAYDGSGVRVAVLDSGIYNHPDLDLGDQRNFVEDQSSSNYGDPNGHGTHVAGIIASSGDSSEGEYRGIAPGVTLINARVGTSYGGIREIDAIQGMEWAADPSEGNADILSMSFGGGYPDPYDAMTAAISNIVDNGVICVVSAGNSGPEYLTGGSPASGVDAISVGATDKDNELATFSSFGPSFTYIGYPDIVAPGVDIISSASKDSVIGLEKEYTENYFDFSGDGDYLPLSGTSMACPVVSGALAILLDKYSTLTPEAARIALYEGATALPNNNGITKAGAGLINVANSLAYLDSSSEVNNITSFFPSQLPVEPFDLLNFPGDHQSLNITVLSGIANTYDIEIPSVSGITITADKASLTYADAGVDFLTLDIKINHDASPGLYSFQVNLTRQSDGLVSSSLNISLGIRLPEYKVLMESYHGLNDMFPEISFYQMDFYEAMSAMAMMNISVDYLGEYWTPNYDDDTNSILTEEKLGQYDLVVLQTPVLPFSPLEMVNLKQFFNNGGDILFLGTRYQDLCVQNTNILFSELGTGISINQQNVADENWLGIGVSVSSQSVDDFSSSPIFDGVSNFIWKYGNTFSTSGVAESIATLDGKTVAAAYNGTASGKGKMVAFGDLSWMGFDYPQSNYASSHSILLENVMDYLLSEEDLSFNIGISSYFTDASQINISVYMKNQTNDQPISSSLLNDYLNVSVEQEGSYFEHIVLSSSSDGIALDENYNLPSADTTPYTIKANITLGGKFYNTSSKFLRYSSIPTITSLTANDDNITRTDGQSITLDADVTGEDEATLYMSIYSYSYYNSRMTVNKTADISNLFNQWSFDPSTSDPTGYGVYYIIPEGSGYINPHSPRDLFRIVNFDPSIKESDSSFKIGEDGQEITFDETSSDEGSTVYLLEQKDEVIFSVAARDAVSYEDNNDELRVSVNLFICSIVGNFINYIFPTSFVYTELDYSSDDEAHAGTFTIPETMKYSTLDGVKSINSTTDFHEDGNYVAILVITVVDSEGGSEDFIIITSIAQTTDSIDLLLLILIIAIVIIIIVVVIVLILRKKRRQ